MSYFFLIIFCNTTSTANHRSQKYNAVWGNSMLLRSSALPVMAYGHYIPHSFVNGNNGNTLLNINWGIFSITLAFAHDSKCASPRLQPFCPMTECSCHMPLKPKKIFITWSSCHLIEGVKGICTHTLLLHHPDFCTNVCAKLLSVRTTRDRLSLSIVSFATISTTPSTIRHRS